MDYNEILSLISEYNKKIEAEVRVLNNKSMNKIESIKKLLQLDYSIKRHAIPYFEHCYLLYHRIKGTEIGMALIVEKLDEQTVSVLKSVFTDTELILYSLEPFDNLFKIKIEEETKFVLKDSNDIFTFNLEKYAIDEFNTLLFNIKKRF